ncbi:MAG: cytidylyltransferase domain-containing protein [Candidatus Thorarchaeota archaeon]|jgi:spore coat polysaccharide biosynthesis protein SpsF
MRISCIIQARTGSTRLPNKILQEVSGKQILVHVVERVLRSSRIDEVIVATTTNLADRQIVNLVENLDHERVSVYCGSEEDVLDRYYQAALNRNSDVIVRITSDCPLIDWELLDRMVIKFVDGGYDYISNVLTKRTYPRGLDVEVFSFSVLKKMWESREKKREREHVTTYVRENPSAFKTLNFEQDTDLSDLRWTVDEEDDLSLIRMIYKELYHRNPDFKTSDILELIKKKPELATMNIHVEQKSFSLT